MLTTTFIHVEGCRFWVPAFLEEYWPYDIALADFPTFCGAGEGFGDRVVPDTIWGLSVAPVCFVHDIDWAICEASDEGFHHANARFRHNLFELVRGKSSWSGIRWLRERRALIYYQMVEAAGKNHFKTDPECLENYRHPLDHPVVAAKFEKLGLVIHGS